MTQPSSKTFTLDFQVRDYELDQYGVVNNAVYLNYLEHTRHEFLISIGVQPAQLAAAGASLTLSGITVRFRAPLRSKERFRAHIAVSRLTGVRAVFHQWIVALEGEAPAVEAWPEALFLDGQGRPMRIPAEVREKLAAFLEVESSGRAGKRKGPRRQD